MCVVDSIRDLDTNYLLRSDLRIACPAGPDNDTDTLAASSSALHAEHYHHYPRCHVHRRNGAQGWDDVSTWLRCGSPSHPRKAVSLPDLNERPDVVAHKP